MSGTRGLSDITQTAANMVLVTMRPSAVLGSPILGASAWCRSDCETETVAQPAWSSFWTLTGPSLTKSTPQELKPATEATNPKIWLRWGSDEKSVHPIRNNLAASYNQRSCPLLAIKNNTAIMCTFSDLCVISIFPIQSIKPELRHTGIICHFHYKYPSTASIWQKNKKTKQNNNKNSSSEQPKQHYFSLFSTAATPNVVLIQSASNDRGGSKKPSTRCFYSAGWRSGDRRPRHMTHIYFRTYCVRLLAFAPAFLCSAWRWICWT